MYNVLCISKFWNNLYIKYRSLRNYINLYAMFGWRIMKGMARKGVCLGVILKKEVGWQWRDTLCSSLVTQTLHFFTLHIGGLKRAWDIILFSSLIKHIKHSNRGWYDPFHFTPCIFFFFFYSIMSHLLSLSIKLSNIALVFFLIKKKKRSDIYIFDCLWNNSRVQSWIVSEQYKLKQEWVPIAFSGILACLCDLGNGSARCYYQLVFFNFNPKDLRLEWSITSTDLSTEGLASPYSPHSNTSALALSVQGPQQIHPHILTWPQKQLLVNARDLLEIITNGLKRSSLL